MISFEQLKSLMPNWVDGMAEHVVTYNVCTCLDAWRNLCHDHLPAINHQKEMLMNEFNGLSNAQILVDLKKCIQHNERITSRWSDLAQVGCSEEHAISKVKLVLPNSTYKHMDGRFQRGEQV